MNEAPSEFQVEVVQLGEVVPLPNSDSLDITQVHGGYPCISKRGTFKQGDLAVYVPIDALVPTDKPDFAFLKKGDASRHRIRAMRLRGTFSMGLLISCPEGFKVGDDMAGYFDIIKYEPVVKGMTQSPNVPKGMNSRGPNWMPVYGVEGFRRHSDILQEGEAVYITEKIHGCNARYSFTDGKLYVGSHKSFRGTTRGRVSEFFNRLKLKIKTLLGIKHRADLIANQGDVWWRIAESHQIKSKLEKFPGLVIYGEIYGQGVQDLDYGSNYLDFVLFDVYDPKTKKYYTPENLKEFAAATGFKLPPILFEGSWSKELLKLADGKTVLGNGRHIREGMVVKSAEERVDPRMGRVSLKVISEAYLLRKEG